MYEIKEKLSLIYEIDSFSFIELCLKLVQVIKQNYSEFIFYTGGNQIEEDELMSKIDNSNRRWFEFETDVLEIDMSKHIDEEYTLLTISIKEYGNENWWRDLVDMLIKMNGFINAWLVDYEYSLWQNNDDVESYKRHGKPYEHLPLIDNGWPPPVNRMIIDTSNNVGLRKICMGYVEAIGAHMWFSDKFLKILKKDVEEIRSACDAKIEKIEEGLYHLSSSVETFKDSTTEAEQRRLRNALYDKTWEVKEE